MDLSLPTWWWLATGILVAAELATGTFYLLMLALGAAAGALAAHLGLPLPQQWFLASVVAAGATAAWHFRRARRPRSLTAELNRDVNIDIGAQVFVEAWQPDGTARVAYRGSSWTVRLAGAGVPVPGQHRIVSVQGGWLGVEPV